MLAAPLDSYKSTHTLVLGQPNDQISVLHRQAEETIRTIDKKIEQNEEIHTTVIENLVKCLKDLDILGKNQIVKKVLANYTRAINTTVHHYNHSANSFSEMNSTCEKLKILINPLIELNLFENPNYTQETTLKETFNKANTLILDHQFAISLQLEEINNSKETSTTDKVKKMKFKKPDDEKKVSQIIDNLLREQALFSKVSLRDEKQDDQCINDKQNEESSSTRSIAPPLSETIHHQDEETDTTEIRAVEHTEPEIVQENSEEDISSSPIESLTKKELELETGLTAEKLKETAKLLDQITELRKADHHKKRDIQRRINAQLVKCGFTRNEGTQEDSSMVLTPLLRLYSLFRGERMEQATRSHEVEITLQRADIADVEADLKAHMIGEADFDFKCEENDRSEIIFKKKDTLRTNRIPGLAVNLNALENDTDLLICRDTALISCTEDKVFQWTEQSKYTTERQFNGRERTGLRLDITTLSERYRLPITLVTDLTPDKQKEYGEVPLRKIPKIVSHGGKRYVRLAITSGASQLGGHYRVRIEKLNSAYMCNDSIVTRTDDDTVYKPRSIVYLQEELANQLIDTIPDELPNTGNTCYQAAALQVLFFIPDTHLEAISKQLKSKLN